MKYTDFVNYNLSMLTDRVRVERYRQAILRTVRPGDVVVDLGCGSGVLSFFACQAGARKVYAIESEEVIEIARQVALQNGFQDRIVFINNTSFRVDLPEKTDVLLTETIGTFGFDEGMLGSVIDARERFLKPAGKIIPHSLELFMVPVELPGFYQHMVDFWANRPLGVDYSPVRRFAANNLHPLKLHQQAFLSEPRQVQKVLFPQADRADFEYRASYFAGRRGWLHGLAGWFVADLLPGLSLTNAPSEESHWGLAFFPIEAPVFVQRGTGIRVSLSMDNNASVWNWHIEANGKDFAQSTLYGFAQLPEQRHKLLPDTTPRMSDQGKAEYFLLGLLNGERTLPELQEQLLVHFPELFRTAEQSMAFLSEVIMRCA